jgi:hypothetical protein
MPPKPITVRDGYCQCGCGQKTNISKNTNPRLGHVRGEPLRYLLGHRNRLSHEPFIIDPASGCWVWQRGRDHDGYGRVSANGRTVRAHRMMYERIRGPIPVGAELDHLCRNPSCVNPDHLEPVSTAVNVRRGRQSKLTLDDVQEIRDLAATHTQRQIAAMYHVGQTTIGHVIRRESWDT